MKKVFLLVLVLVLGSMSYAQTKIQFRSADKAECVKSDYAGFEATFSFSSLNAENVETTRGALSEIYVEGAFPSGNVGEPQLPMITKLIAIPTGATPLVTVGAHSETEYTLSDFGIGTVSAMQAPIRKSDDPSTVEYAFNEAVYARNSYNDDPIAMVEVLGTMRGITLGRLLVKPVRYNPAAGTVKVYNDIEVSVDFENGDAASTAEMFSNTCSPAFQAVYDQIFNMDMLMGGSRDAYTDHPDLYKTPVKMLVICYSGFQGNAALNSWLEWKLQKGYYVDIYYTSETGTSASSIKSFIQTKYNASVSAGNAYTYLIVIGDTGQVPQYMTKNIDSSIGNCASDLGYAAVNFTTSSTTNYFPDMYYSRISVENTTHLTNYMNKVLTYEKYEFTDGGNFLNNVILVGGWDSSWTSRVAKPTINYATNNYFNSNNTTYGGFSGGTINATVSTSSSAGYSGTNNGVYNGINNGVCFLNYTAHGDKQEWYQPKMTAAHVATLSNTGKYFFGVGNCCLTGNFNNTTTDYSPGSAIGTNACFAEAMIRVPNAGAIAYVGCSPYSYWYEDFYWAVGAHSYSQGNAPSVSGSTKGVYDVMFQDQWNSASALLYLGNLAVQQAVSNGNTNSSITDGNCNNSAHYYFQFYHCFGDGSVMPYITKPETNSVTIPSTVTPGTSSITVNAVAGSYVAVTDNSSIIYGVGVANSSGVATVNFDNAIPSSGTLYVVVTRQQYQPYFGTITVQGGTQYTISATASPAAGGTVTGAGQYYSGTNCTLTATPATGYTFTNWKKGNSVVSTNATYTFEVTGNASYTATFTAIPQYTISVTANPTAGGTVSGGGTFYENTSCTLTATPNTGYTFTNWKKGNTVVSTNATYTFNVTEAASYTATFTAIPQYTITVQANPTAGGTVSGGGTFYENTSCTITATTNNGYTFTNWTKNGTQVSTNPTYTFTVTANGTYVANYEQLIAHSVTCNEVEGGTLSASVNTAFMGDVITLTATPNNNYFFSAWDVRDANNNPISVSNNQFTMPNVNVTVSATFVQGCNVTIADVDHGTVTASATFAVPGTTITLTATPETNYVLSRWMVFKTGDVREGVAVTGNTFVLPAYDVTVVGIFKMPKESEVAIGSGTSADSYLPTYAYYKYSLTQQIYTAAEVGSAGTITKIAFKVSNSKSTTRTLDVYLKTTTKDAFTSTTGWETMSSNDKVYSGSVAFQSSGWTTITLSTPFEYDGTSNLVLCVDDNTGSYVSSSSNSPKFYVYGTNANRAMRVYSDGTNYTASSPSSYTGTYVTSNNQVTFTMTTAGSDASLAVSPNVLNGFTYAEGAGTSEAQSFAVIGVDLTEDITVTAPENFQISDEEYGTYGNTLTLTAESKGNRETLTYDFEDGWQNWTTFQGSTTSPNSWMHNTEYPTSNNDFSSGYGYDSSDGFMLSESYISGSSSGSGTAVTPDNYLVSPQVTLGGSMTFQVGVQNVSYCEEHFSVMVSTTGNTSASNFTTVQTWTYSANATSGSEWQEFTVDLSAYSGTGYIAIRHFDCYDQWILKIDNVNIVQPEDTPVTPTDPTIDLLTANVYVRMVSNLIQGNYSGTATVTSGEVTSNVTLNGEVTEGEYINYYITATANPTNGGTVTGAGVYHDQATPHLVATANEGYHFVNWTENGVEVSIDSTYFFTCDGNRDLVANFELNSYEITVTVNPENAGNVAGAHTYNHFETCELTAAPVSGYNFVNWTIDGEAVSDQLTYSFQVTEAVNLVANFNQLEYNVTIATNDENAGTAAITEASPYHYGDIITLTYTVNPGYEFVNFTVGEEMVTSPYTVTGDAAIVANFEPILVEQTVNLELGWNWWSTYLNITIDDLKAAMNNSGSITSHTSSYLSYVNGIGWMGSLNAINPAEMYKFQLNSNISYELSATPVDPSQVEITLLSGDNWIGYPVQQSMSLNDAFSEINPANNDKVTSYEQFAIYYEGNWYGGLNTLEPGKGYIYQTTETILDFTYPAATRGITKPNVSMKDNQWVPVIGKYSDVMSVTLKVNLNGIDLSSDEVEVAAFCNGECRGSAKLSFVEPMNGFEAFLPVYGNDGDVISLKVYNQGETFDANEQVVMKSNNTIGHVDNPFVIHAGGFSTMSLFPNPADKGQNVHMELPTDTDFNGAVVEVYNALGTLVSTETLSAERRELSGLLTSGIYTVKVTDQKGNVLYSKLIVR